MPSNSSLSAKRLLQEEAYREQAKAAYEQHTSTTGSLDILQRCKKLNDFLASDFLKQGPSPGNKEQLKEMLSILNAGPKRPSFLDKPPVTSTAGKKKLAVEATAKQISSREAEKLLGLIEPEESCSGRLDVASGSRPAAQQEDVDDVIGLLNSNAAAKTGDQAALRDQEAKLQQEQQRLKQEAEQKLREAQMKEERRLDEEKKLKEQQRKEEERRQEEQRLKEAAAVQRKQEEAQRLKEEAQRREVQRKQEEAQRREEARLKEEARKREEAARRKAEVEQAAERARQLEQRRQAAALVIQRYSRGLLARRCAAWARERRSAAIALQVAVRARACRRLLQGLQVVAFTRRRAARCIASYYAWYRKQWRLGPVHGPVRGGPASALDGHAHLLDMPVRLRCLADARLAPEDKQAQQIDGKEASGSSSASGLRTIASARHRAGLLTAQQGRQRDDVGARVLMAVSEHRDLQAAMQAVKTGGCGSQAIARTSSAGRAASSSGSGSRPGSGGAEKKL